MNGHSEDDTRKRSLLRQLGHLNDQLVDAGAQPLALDAGAEELDVVTLRDVVNASARKLSHFVGEANR